MKNEDLFIHPGEDLGDHLGGGVGTPLGGWGWGEGWARGVAFTTSKVPHSPSGDLLGGICHPSSASGGKPSTSVFATHVSTAAVFCIF